MSELAAGAVIVTPGGRKVLLLHEASEDRWCFPKGHVEAGETREAAARREVLEEAGLDGLELRGELASATYRFYDPAKDRSIVKTSVYFLARSLERPARLEPTFDRYEWVPPEDALTRVPFEEEREIVRALQRSIAAGRV